MIRKKREKIQLGYIVLFLFAIRAVSDVILAFEIKIIALARCRFCVIDNM